MTPALRRYLSGRMRRDHARCARGCAPATTAAAECSRSGLIRGPGSGAAARELVERLLHPRADHAVDLDDVGLVAELVADVDRLQHPGLDLRGQREVRRERERQAPREAEGDRDVLRAQPLLADRTASRSARRGRGGSGPPGRRCSPRGRSGRRPRGRCGRSPCGRRSRSCCARDVGRKASWSPPGNTIVTPPRRSTAAAFARLAGTNPARRIVTLARPGEQQVVREAVDRPVVAEVVEERDREHRHVHRDQPAGVVGDHQRAALGDVLDAVHRRAEPAASRPGAASASAARRTRRLVAGCSCAHPATAARRQPRPLERLRVDAGPGPGGRRRRRAPAGWRPGRRGCSGPRCSRSARPRRARSRATARCRRSCE